MSDADTADAFTPPAARVLRRFWSVLSGPAGPGGYDLARFVVLRALGFVYLIAFWVAVDQLVPLVGERGLTPAATYLPLFGDGDAHAWWENPTLFWFDVSDHALLVVAWSGLLLSAAVVAGVTHGGVMLLLWTLYLSIDHVGQRWYQFGWETQLLETGLLVVFWCPWRTLRPFPPRSPAGAVPAWLLRWLAIRIMLGAGLIKLRGDPCWTALTCLDYHFETQPIPGPLSRFFHQLPHGVHATGVVFNHVAELVAPWFLFGPRRVRHIAAVVVIGFQVTLIVSGNLAFLNWLTIVPCLACLDDGVWRRVLPRRLWRALDDPDRAERPPRGSRIAAWVYAAVVVWLSLPVVANLIGRGQSMNRAYDRFHIVNTYGAFGSVHEERWELVIEGTDDETPDDDADWRAYALPCQPGDPGRRPCSITPYHRRLDWLMWFAALEVEFRGGLAREDWILHLVYQLLAGEPQIRELLSHDPFDGAGPRWIRVVAYRYRFSEDGDAWWGRDYLGVVVPPQSLNSPQLLQFLQVRGYVGET